METQAKTKLGEPGTIKVEESDCYAAEGDKSPLADLKSMDNFPDSGSNGNMEDGIHTQPEQKLCTNALVTHEKEIHGNDDFANMVETVHLPSTANGSDTCDSEAEINPTRIPSPLHDLEPVEQMEVAVAKQLGTLTFKSESNVANVANLGETGQPLMGVHLLMGNETAEAAGEMKDIVLEDTTSDSDTDSDSSSSTSSSSSSSLSLMLPGELEEEPTENKEVQLKTKDELLLDELPSVEEVSIILPEDVELKPFGIVSSIIEQLVIIESLKDIPPLNEESVIFKDDRHAVGKIFEVFGPVPHPFYVIRFNAKDQIETKGIKIRDAMFFAPMIEDFTQYIIPDKLKQDRGSDASWTNDQEPPVDVLDYSDDEKEKKAKQKKKTQNAEKKKSKSEQEGTSSSVQEQKHSYGEQKPSKPHPRKDHGPRFSRGRASHLHGNAFGQPHRTYFPTGFSGQHLMQQSYPLHNTGSQEYSMTLPHNGQGHIMPHLYRPHFGDVHHFSGPPPPLPDMVWSEPNMHVPYMQNSPFFPPPPPPPPPPPRNPNHSHFGPHY